MIKDENGQKKKKKSRSGTLGSKILGLLREKENIDANRLVGTDVLKGDKISLESNVEEHAYSESWWLVFFFNHFYGL